MISLFIIMGIALFLGTIMTLTEKEIGPVFISAVFGLLVYMVVNLLAWATMQNTRVEYRSVPVVSMDMEAPEFDPIRVKKLENPERFVVMTEFEKGLKTAELEAGDIYLQITDNEESQIKNYLVREVQDKVTSRWFWNIDGNKGEWEVNTPNPTVDKNEQILVLPMNYEVMNDEEKEEEKNEESEKEREYYDYDYDY